MKSAYYHQFLPNAVLKPYMRSYFFISTPSAASHLPADGCLGLIINLKDPFLSRITAALSSIWHNKGHLAIDKLAGSLHLSRRHLERLFLNHIGLPPKRMCRIIRFLSIFSSSKITEKPNWADIALANGFSDQAHLIRECSYFAGKSPFSYLTNRSPFEQAIIRPNLTS